jgi:hypothetical protein
MHYMLETTKPPSETQAITGWVGKIRPWGFVVGKNRQSNRDPNALNRGAYWAAPLVTKGASRKMDSER